MDGETETTRPEKAYENDEFLNSRDARPLRILAEYLELRDEGFITDEDYDYKKKKLLKAF